MIGRPPSELLGHLISDAIPETIGSRFEGVSHRVAATGRSERFIEFHTPLDATFSVVASPLPGGISVYFHDVSEEGGAASPPVEQPRGSTRLQALQRTA